LRQNTSGKDSEKVLPKLKSESSNASLEIGGQYLEFLEEENSRLDHENE
jgi:hypothetical protein